MQLKDLVPRLAGKVKARVSEKGKMPQFQSFEAALAGCGSDGYEQAEIAEVVLRKTAAYRLRLIAEDHPCLTANQVRQLFPLALAARNGSLSVLDLGGGCGVHYFLARKIFGKELRLRWSVVETSAMVEKALSLASDELHFYTDLKTATAANPQFALAFSSGALQYLPSPYEALESLMLVGAQHLFLTRVALSPNDQDYVFIHESKLNRHGRGGPLPGVPDIRTRCPTVFASKPKLERLLAGKYEIILELAESTRAYECGNLSFNQYGYYCRLRE
jgi:putative methyltransferase (TIGR04325 family)